MNILMLSWRDPKHPLAGGAEQVMHGHAKGWIKAGHSVTLFSSKFKGSDEQEVIDGIRVIRGGSQNFLGVQIAAWRYYLKNSDSFDFLVDMFHGYPFFTPLYSNKPKVAVIQEVARHVWFLNPLPFPLSWIVGFIGLITEPLIFRFYRKVPFITGSLSAKKDVARFGIPEKKITIIPHGVIVRPPKPFPKKEKKNTVVFLGVLARDKGIEDAIMCFADLKAKGQFNFWVIGRSETKEYEQKIKSLVKTLGLEKDVVFWGFVSQEKKFDLLARAHVLINPSVHEGWGLVNIEANAMGTPVIAYRSSGLVDSVKDGLSGILVSENTPESLAKFVLELFDDQKRYKRLSQSSVSWSKNFSWEKSIRQTLKLIEST